jgi:hypothetical protein
MDASTLGAAAQLLYVRLAAKRGNWRDLDRHGLEPTEMMKRLFISMRAKYIAWKRRRDAEDEIEAATPKFWFELETGHWVFEKNEEAAKGIHLQLRVSLVMLDLASRSFMRLSRNSWT